MSAALTYKTVEAVIEKFESLLGKMESLGWDKLETSRGKQKTLHHWYTRLYNLHSQLTEAIKNGLEHSGQQIDSQQQGEKNEPHPSGKENEEERSEEERSEEERSEEERSEEERNGKGRNDDDAPPEDNTAPDDEAFSLLFRQCSLEEIGVQVSGTGQPLLHADSTRGVRQGAMVLVSVSQEMATLGQIGPDHEAIFYTMCSSVGLANMAAVYKSLRQAKDDFAAASPQHLGDRQGRRFGEAAMNIGRAMSNIQTNQFALAICEVLFCREVNPGTADADRLVSEADIEALIKSERWTKGSFQYHRMIGSRIMAVLSNHLGAIAALVFEGPSIFGFRFRTTMRNMTLDQATQIGSSICGPYLSRLCRWGDRHINSLLFGDKTQPPAEESGVDALNAILQGTGPDAEANFESRIQEWMDLYAAESCDCGSSKS